MMMSIGTMVPAKLLNIGMFVGTVIGAAVPSAVIYAADLIELAQRSPNPSETLGAFGLVFVASTMLGMTVGALDGPRAIQKMGSFVDKRRGSRSNGDELITPATPQNQPPTARKTPGQ